MEEDKPVKEKSIIGKIREVAEDKEHQIEFLGTVVRLGVVVWSGSVSYTHLTLPTTPYV